MILGASGTGKSASMRNLDPARYGLVNVASKPLPFKTTKKGLETDDYSKIKATLLRATSDLIVIDDAQFLMANPYMRSATMKFDKNSVFEFYKTLGYDFWDLIQFVVKMPAEKIVYFLGHTEINELGQTKFKTIGKMLDEKVTLEGMFTIVLRTYLADHKYYFSTQNDGTDTVKTPIGMFQDMYIENDLAIVDSAIREYYGLKSSAPTTTAPAPAAAKPQERSLV